MPNARPPLPPWVPSAGSRARLTVAVTLLLVAAALFNPPSPFAAPSTPILLLDESLSMAGAGETWPVLSRAVREATGSNRVQLIPFGAQVLPHIDTSLNAPAPPSRQLDRTGTNIEVALRAAFDVASAHQPIVLWSDGRETRGAATPLLADAARHGRRVYSLQVPPPTSGAVLVDVDLPVRVTEGALFPVVVRARSVTAGLATLDVFRDDKLAESHTFELRAGAPSASVVSLAARGRQPFDLRFRLAADPAGGWDES